MAKKTSTQRTNAFTRKPVNDPFAIARKDPHVYGHKHVCSTDSMGFATPGNRSPLEIVVDASEGFIPLWARGMTLRWRFNERSLRFFEDPEAAKAQIRKLFAEAVTAWGTSAPVRFAERKDAWDFELYVRNSDDCDISGCTLASAFFPDGGRHKLTLYPLLFDQTHQEQVSTLEHEIGHVFGLRHFFAKLEEKEYPSVIFGKHKPFSIMNYGAKSRLTATDRSDLKKLYEKVWSGELAAINGTRIVQVKPYHLR